MTPQDSDTLKDLQCVHTVLQENPLLNSLNNNLILTKKQKTILWERILALLNINSFVKDYILSLSRLGALNNLGFILQGILNKINSDTMIIFATSTTPLNKEMKEEITHFLIAHLPFLKEKRFQWHTAIDPDLLGGYTLSVGPYWVDRSVKTQLKKLEARVKKQ
jgi:F0F1-type ATP synthase delta subunit